MYLCPFCKGENKMNINVNHAISNNIIKELINHIKIFPTTPEMMDRMAGHFLYNQNMHYINENINLKSKIKELETKLNEEKNNFLLICDENMRLNFDKNSLKLELETKKRHNKKYKNKLNEIINILNSASDFAYKSKLHKDITAVLSN